MQAAEARQLAMEEILMELEKIIIASNDKRFSLTPENAKELQRLLNDIFPFEEDQKPDYLEELRKIIQSEMPKSRPYYPIYPYYENWYQQRPWITWTSNDVETLGNDGVTYSGATVTYESGNTVKS